MLVCNVNQLPNCYIKCLNWRGTKEVSGVIGFVCEKLKHNAARRLFTGQAGPGPCLLTQLQALSGITIMWPSFIWGEINSSGGIVFLWIDF